MTLSLVLLLLAQPVDAFDSKTPFKAIDARGGCELSGRRVPGSRFSEFQVVTHAPYPPDTLCAVIFDWATTAEGQGGGKKPTLLEEGEGRRVVYNQVQQPLVADRDYAITVVRQTLSPTACRVRFWASNELAPPKPDGWVRMEKLWGTWTLEAEQGGSRLSYVFFADPGGSIPAFLASGAQKAVARDTVVAALDEVRRRTERAP